MLHERSPCFASNTAATSTGPDRIAVSPRCPHAADLSEPRPPEPTGTDEPHPRREQLRNGHLQVNKAIRGCSRLPWREQLLTGGL